jgi:predicted nucleic acid-binding protein
MPFVIDASVAVSWAFLDEDHPTAASALNRIRYDEAVAPSLWWFEIRNTLLVGERRGRLTEMDTDLFLRELERFGVAIDHAPRETTILSLARQHRLTVYDASYLELAQREALPLATLDTALQRAAVALKIELIDA